MEIIVCADNLLEADFARIEAACAGWAGVRRLAATAPQRAEAILAADVVVGWADARLLRDGRVHTYLCGSAGLDAYVGHGLDRKPGYRQTNAAGTMTVTIAEHCLAMMFALTRQLPVLLRQQSAKTFARRWHGDEVCGKRACVVGLGGAGMELARRLAALGMKVSGVRRRWDLRPPGADEMFAPADLPRAVAEAEHVFCLVPGGPQTRGMFDAGVFAAMKAGAYFYNASRGSTVDEAALLDALNSGKLAGAGLDVVQEEPLAESSALWDCPGVLITAHSAGHSRYLSGRLTDLFIENLLNLQHGRPLRNQIDPERLR